MKRLSLAALCLAIALPAFAVDNLSKGMEFYNSGRYDKALAYLQDTVSKNPRAWKGHYYLANTYLALGQRDEAFQQYRMTQYLKPTPDVAASCEKIVSKIAASAQRSSGMPDTSRMSTTQQEYMIQRKQDVMNAAGLHAQVLRDSTRQDINANVNSSGASYGTSYIPSTIDNARAQRLHSETEMRVQKMFDEAEKKAKEMK